MTSHAMKRNDGGIPPLRSWMKTQRENLASSADVMETEENSARLGEDAEKIFGVTGIHFSSATTVLQPRFQCCDQGEQGQCLYWLCEDFNPSLKSRTICDKTDYFFTSSVGLNQRYFPW